MNPAQADSEIHKASIHRTIHSFRIGISIFRPAGRARPPPASHATQHVTWEELAKIQLQKETQELEVRKLELQLQLASLERQVPSTNPAALDSSTKSLSDLKAPNGTLFPQPWPHIFAPGEPKLIRDLSLAEFCAGYAVIIQNCKIPSQKEQLLQHFQDLMTLASSYKWSAVCSFHSKVLRSIELGLTITSNDQTAFLHPNCPP